MRIAICTSYPVHVKVAGGGAVIVRYLVEALSSQNIDVVLWLCRDYLAPVEVKATAKTIDSPEYWEFIGFPPQLAFSLKEFAPQDFKTLQKQTLELQDQTPVDVVIIFSPVTPGLWPMELAESLNIPYILTLLDYSFLCPTFTRYNYRGEFCQGIIPEANCLECSLAKIPPSKRSVFKVLQHLPKTFKRWLGRKQSSFFPAMGRYHAGSASARSARQIQIQSLFNKAAAVIYQTPVMQYQFHQAGWQHPNEHIECFGIPRAKKLDKIVKHDDPVIQFVYLSRPTPEWGINFLLQTWLTYFRDKTDRQLTILSPGVLSLFEKHLEWQNLRNVVFSEEMIQGKVAEFHAKFHVLILPGQWQGIVALTSLEALAYGTVVIEPDLGGLAGHNLDETSGVINYQWRSAESLKEAIDSICNNRQQLHQLLTHPRQVRTTQDGGVFYRNLFQDIQSKK
jgi:glycosyltransferase involved in cell wall biosynthesis